MMAFLPKTLVPVARRYIDPDRMRAADLIVAKDLLDRRSRPGTLSVFIRDHLDPARAERADLQEKIDELDEIDLQGWLLRILLQEYLRLGEALHPGEPDDETIRDAEEFARWLNRLAVRAPGEDALSLTFSGRYFRVAVIFVGIKGKLEEEGIKPYRKRAKRFLYREQYDAIYLMARDDNIPAVEELAANLETDGRVQSVETYPYALRSDFRARYGLNRERAVIARIGRRRVADPTPPDVELELDELEEIPVESYEPPPLEPKGESLFTDEGSGG